MSRKNEEMFLRDIKKTNRNFKLSFRINLEDQKWLNYSVIGSFVFLVILNSILPSNPVQKAQLELNSGLLGVALAFFGSMFLLNALFAGGGFLTGLIGVVLCIILFYSGLPLLLGFQW